MRFKKMPTSIINIAYGILLLLAAVPALSPVIAEYRMPALVLDKTSPLDKSASNMTMGFACEECLMPSVHGSNVIEKRDGGLFATWFGGSREGGRDVVVWGSDYSVQTSSWSKPRPIVGPAETKQSLGRYIKTVGNSVLARGEQDALWLYYVTVSVGGWAGSSVNSIVSYDDGITWSEPRRLVTSPFFNVSTLIKCPAVHYSDGTIGLPVYHELIGKFSELLHLDKGGNVLSKIRITHGRNSIQPLLFPLEEHKLMALMRDTGHAPGSVRQSQSDDAGQYWTPETRLSLPNADSAVGGLRRPDGSLLLVFNDTKIGRNSLALAVSRDQGQTWHTVRHFEQSGDAKDEYSYPYLIRAGNGSMHLLYTWNRKRIRHVVFNDAWVDGVKP